MIKILLVLILFATPVAVSSAFLLDANNNKPDNEHAVTGERAVINGYVRDKGSGETLVGATIQLKDSRFGTVTNKHGYYSLADIPPGSYTVVFSYIGYGKQELEITLKANDSRRIDIELEEEAFTMDEVVVEGDRLDDTRQINISRVNIPVRQITQLRIGGEADIFLSIQ